MAEDEALKKLQTRNAYLEKERIELRQQVQRMEKDETTREAVIRAMETENTRLLKDVKGLRDKVGQLTYDLGVVTRRGSVSSRPRDSPLPEIPQEDTETRVFQIETTEEESSGGYAKITNAVGRIAEDSGSEEDKSPNFEEEPDLKPPDSPRRKRTLTMDDIHVRLESPESGFLDAPQSRSRVHTVGNGLGLVDQWKRSHSRGVSTSGIPSLRPVIIPHKKTSKSARDHGRSYPIAPYMEEKIRKKIREEIGKKYGGLERVTKAAVAIQRWYNDACRRRHWKMLQGMAANQPKKLRQRTKSMRQSGYRPRGYTVSAEPVANGGRHAMKKYASILEEFPQYKSIAEKCGTPRTRRKKSSNTADSTNSLPGSPMVEQASIQFPPSEPDQEPKPNHKPQQEPKPLDRKPTVKKMTIQSSSSEDSAHREGGSLSPGVDSGIYNNSPPPGEEGLSIVGESRLEKISEFRVVDSQTAFLKGERESATTMRRKINIGINYFNRKPWKGLVYLVQRRVLEDSPGKIASFFISRVDLSKEKIGEFLGDIQSEFCQAVLEEMVLLMNFQKKTVDEALRVFQAHFLMPGEAQKIEKIVEVFANGYYEANKGADEELKSVFDSSDAIFVLSYAIMMLNTDLHNPNVRRHLTRLEWLKMNKGINGGGDFPAEFLIGVYNRILRSPFMPAQDHTHDVDSIEKSIIGCPKLVQTHRRLLYKCRVMELEGDAQKPRPKFLFVFNDLLLVTKPRARDYQFKAMIPLMGANIVKFESMGAGNKCAEASMDDQLRVNLHCRKHSPPIKFISCGVFGVFSFVFCDFGDTFDVVDEDGEDYEEVFIHTIAKGNPGVVKIQEDGRHGLQDGDCVTFKEVGGMTALNDTVHSVKVRSPSEFTVGDLSPASFAEHTHGGIVQKVKVTKKVTFESLAKQVNQPDLLLADFAKPEAPIHIHAAFQALWTFQKKNSSLPILRSQCDAEEMVQIAKDFVKSANLQVEVDTTLVQHLAFTARGLLPPLAAAIGGIVAHEALISLTGKFTPLKQWLFLDAMEMQQGLDQAKVEDFQPRGDRYDNLRACIGDDLLTALANQKLFMIGCGAIGCEMLKNYAMLGLGRGPLGGVTITDNDVIEKSNLNRQFLFRPRHIQQPKSTVAAASTVDLNKDLKIDAHEYKVGPQSENVYSNKFFQDQSLVVNALDNVEARRYVDSRCVTNQCPLLESGTMGTKGHVQVIVPHMTECYSSQQDPPEQDIPYCTLKSFPANVDHTIQWARDKFESAFVLDPEMYSKFWETNKGPENVLKNRHSVAMENIVKVSKLLRKRPTSWPECVAMARIKFEKSYNHKAKNLLLAFPEDYKLKNGSPFWQLPKRPPKPLTYEPSNELHLSFVKSMARLYADVWTVPYSKEDLTNDRLVPIVSSVKVPPFKPSKKNIITDESVGKPQSQKVSGDEVERSFLSLAEIVGLGPLPAGALVMNPLDFEKDDDGNGHIDFITAASNLRAVMYGIDAVDRFKTKRIAGRIVPAIATTTAAVAGFVAVELIKVVMKQPLESYKNLFLNLALPTLVFSEPAAPTKTVLAGGFSYTLWDKWEIRGHLELKLSEFLVKVKEMYRLVPSMVVHGVKMVYVPVMPAHRKRLPQTMVKLLKMPENTPYVDLTLSFISPEGGDDIAGPPIRYFIK